MEFWEKIIMYNTHFLELVVAKFNQNLAFAQFFICLYKNYELIKFYIVLKYKIYIVFRMNAWTCSHKNAKSV